MDIEVKKIEISDISKIELWKTGHSVNKIALHIIWCTKYRHPILKDGIDIFVKKIIAETCIEYDWACRSIEIMPDHVHIFIQIKPEDRPIDVVRTLKSISAVAVFHKYSDIKQQKFWGSGLWSKGTYYGSVGQISEEIILKYISVQKEKL
jgi:putative transposase